MVSVTFTSSVRGMSSANPVPGLCGPDMESDTLGLVHRSTDSGSTFVSVLVPSPVAFSWVGSRLGAVSGEEGKGDGRPLPELMDSQV